MQATSPVATPRRFPGELEVKFIRHPIPALEQIASEEGDIVNFKFAGGETFLVKNPDFIKEILFTHHNDLVKNRLFRVAKSFLGEGLLTSEGEFHHRQKRLVQPAFHHQRLASYATIMVDRTLKATETWQEGKVIDVQEEMSRLTCAILAKTLFSADLEVDSRDDADDLAVVLDHFQRISLARLILESNGALRLFNRLPLPSNLRHMEAEKTLDTMIYREVRERREGKANQEDILSMLLQAKDAQGDGSGMSDLQLRNEVISLLIAGNETMGVALTWAWYLLSENPDAETKLHSEVDSVLGGRPPTAEDYPKLKYTSKVIREGMRMYPPIWVFGYQVTKAFALGGHTMPVGSTLVMSQYLMHHDPRYYPEPKRFLPERWTPQFEASLPRFAYFPFGGGPRGCIGEPFAWMEGVLVLATVAQKWRLLHVKGHRVEMLPHINLRAKYGMKMSTLKRK